jgi:hypothetical protein
MHHISRHEGRVPGAKDKRPKVGYGASRRVKHLETAIGSVQNVVWFNQVH